LRGPPEQLTDLSTKHFERLVPHIFNQWNISHGGVNNTANF
jgi:hypothetical protein